MPAILFCFITSSKPERHNVVNDVDDVLDAVAAAWSAMRVARGTAHILGEPEIGAIYA